MSKHLTTVGMKAQFEEYSTFVKTKVWFEKLEDGISVKVWCENFETGSVLKKLGSKIITKKEFIDTPDDDIEFFKYGVGLFGGSL